MDAMPPSARLVGIGFYVALCIVLGAVAGRELDKALDADKVFTLLGLTLGLILALWGSVRQLLDVVRAIDQSRGQGSERDE